MGKAFAEVIGKALAALSFIGTLFLTWVTFYRGFHLRVLFLTGAAALLTGGLLFLLRKFRVKESITDGNQLSSAQKLKIEVLTFTAFGLYLFALIEWLSGPTKPGASLLSSIYTVSIFLFGPYGKAIAFVFMGSSLLVTVYFEVKKNKTV